MEAKRPDNESPKKPNKPTIAAPKITLRPNTSAANQLHFQPAITGHNSSRGHEKTGDGAQEEKKLLKTIYAKGNRTKKQNS